MRASRLQTRQRATSVRVTWTDRQEIPFFQTLIGEHRRAECEWGVAMPKIRPKTDKRSEARGDRPHSRPAGKAQSETCCAPPTRCRPRSARSCASAPRPRPRSRRRANPMSGCARRSTSCRRASCSSMPKAATFSGTRNTPRSTTAARICSSRARGCRTPSASALRAAIIRKRSAARKNGSPSGSRSSISPASATSRRWPTAASS